MESKSVMRRKAIMCATTIPDVGMVATLQMHSDRVVYIITYVSPSGKTIRLRRVERAGKKLMAKAGTEKWVVADWDSEERTARKGKSGQWEQIGHPRYRPIFTIGVADPFYDRSF